MDKNYLTVDEFIEYLAEKEDIKISKRTLRYYAAEKILQPPAKIGGNIAYYTLDQIPRLKLIRLLKSSGLSISQIRQRLSTDTHITADTLAKAEDAVVDGINEALKARVLYLQNTYYNKKCYGSHPLRDSLERLKDNISSTYGKTDYLSFISNITGNLEAFLCALPLNCTDEKLDELLGLTKAERLRERLKKVKVNMGLGNVDRVKAEVKNQIKALIERHIEQLQNVLKKLETA